MEVLLNCFFEHFEKMDRNSLHARYKRRALVNYFNSLIEGCRLGSNGESTAREAIIRILRYHEKSRMENGSVCMLGKYHNILYVALKICYDWKLKDTETVAALLDEIYSCEETFERMLVGALCGTHAPHFIAGWKSDFENQEENVSAMVYYIDHATNANLEYIVNGNLTRFIDVPIESCGKSTCLKIIIQLGLPDKLLIFLRYGARIFDGEKNEKNVVEMLLKRLNEFEKNYPYNYVSCLQLILRAIPIIPNCTSEVALKKFSNLVENSILPTNRCGIQPAELKHLSRCVIREQLWINFQLPNGISALPIPPILQRYIDILED